MLARLPCTQPRLVCLLLLALHSIGEAKHSIGILLPWSANLIGYSGFTSDGTLLYSYSGFGSRAHTAITLAFAAIKKDETMLEEVRDMTWVWHDDGCDVEKGVFAAVQLIAEYGVKGIIGPSCAAITDAVAKVAFYYGLPVIGYSIPSFTNDLPNLIRTMAPFSSLGGSVVGLMREFDWKHIVILYESGDTTGWDTMASSIKATITESNLTYYSTFFLSPSTAGTIASDESVSTALSAVKALGYRIILMIGSCENNLKFGYELYKNSMLEGYAIIRMSTLSDMDCEVTAENNEEYVHYLNRTLYIELEWPTGSLADEFKSNALKAYYSFEQYQTPPNGTATRTGADRGGFNPFNLSYEYSSQATLNFIRLQRWRDEWGFVSYLYDSILLYARALNYTLNNGMNSTYQTFKSAVREVTPFEGAWRSVEFDSTAATLDRVMEGRIYGLLVYNETLSGVSQISVEFQSIASQNSSGFFLLTSNDSILWPGPSSTIPVDFVNATVACNIGDIDSYASQVFASTLTITVSYAYKEGVSCNKQAYAFPSDQILNVDQFPVESTLGVVAVIFACLGTIICASIASFAAYFRNHTLLSHTNLSITSATLVLTFLTACAPLFFLGKPSDALCQARSFAVFLPGFMLSTFKVARIFHLSCMLSAPKVNQHKSYVILCTFFALCTSPLYLLLIIGSAYEPPTTYSDYVQPYNAPLTIIANFGCRNINKSVFGAILVYMVVVVLYGFWITSRVLAQLALAASLWKSSSRVWEVRFMTYCSFIALIGQVLLLVASLYTDQIGVDHFRMIGSITMSLAASVAICVIWIPRIAIILNEGIITPENSHRDGSGSRSPQMKGITRQASPTGEVLHAGVVQIQDLFQVPERTSGGVVLFGGFKRNDGGSGEKKKVKMSVDVQLDDTSGRASSSPRSLV